MTIQRKAIFAALASAALLAGCATGPYYDDYAYGSGYNYGYGGPAYYGPSYYGPSYYGPAYVAPSVGLGLSYHDYDNRRDRRWHRDNRDDRDNRADRVERVNPQGSVVRPNEWRDHNGEIRDSQGRTAADRDRAANSASGG